MAWKLFITSVFLLSTMALLAQGSQKKKIKLIENEGPTVEVEVVPQNVVDIDSNFYKVVKIGEQIWMAENLKTTRLNDGTLIPFVSDAKQWLELKTPAFCWYDEVPFAGDPVGYISTYGLLYNWYAVNTGKLCPDGWHVPSADEWVELEGFLGTEVAGLKMKETGTLHWTSTSPEVTNESGFTAIPGGYRNRDRNIPDLALFVMAGELASWWSASPVSNEISTSFAIYAPVVSGRSPSKNHWLLRRFDTTHKIYGESIRCLKN